MKGYVINKSSIWIHAMKRAIGPGQKVELAELYEQYGVKHDLAEGEEFTQWLKNVKLRDSNKWGVVLESEDSENSDAVVEEAETKEEVKEKELPEKRNESRFSNASAPPVPDKMGVADVVGLSVRQGREVLPKIMDLKLLKYAYEEARQLAGKDSLSREIKKRIRALEISR
jgi:hypothetical protein